MNFLRLCRNVLGLNVGRGIVVLVLVAATSTISLGTSAIGVTSAGAAATGCAPPYGGQVTAYQACIQTGPNSTANYVDYLAAWGWVTLQKIWGCNVGYNSYHMELTGPNGHIVNGPGETICYPTDSSTTEVGSTAALATYNNYVTSGQYCAILWGQNGSANGTWYNDGEGCISVA